MAKIISIKSYFPKNKLTNSELSARFPKWPEEKILEKTGIKSRNIASESETIVDLAVYAAEKIFLDKKLKISKNDIDNLILVTQTPSNLIPSSACEIHQRLGLNVDCAAFDINQGCTGYIYGLQVASSIVDSNNSKITLLITADVYSKIINKNDFSLSTLFGDAATATLIQREVKDNSKFSIGNFYFGTDGNKYNKLLYRNNLSNSAKNTNHFLQMDGPSILEFTLKIIPQAINKYLENNSSSLDNYEYIIFHQANKFILDKLYKKIGIKEKGLIEIIDCGNTTSSSIPITIEKLLKKNGYKKSNILLVGFGSGLSWGVTSIII